MNVSARLRLVLWLAASAVALAGCGRVSGNPSFAAPDADADSDADTDTDSDIDVDADSDADADSETEIEVDTESTPPECVRYADATPAAAAADGLTWDTAFPALQPAIDAAHAAAGADTGPGSCDVWVAAGTYYVLAASRADTVLLRPGVRLFGGFAGGEAVFAERDWDANETILDGRAGPDGAERVYHVVTASDGAVLDGFRIVYGNADGDGGLLAEGGGLIADGVSPIVRHCAFRENVALGSGGAISVHDGAPVISGCAFSANASGTRGGALYVVGGAATVESGAFIWNQAVSFDWWGEAAGGYGGAIYAHLGAELSIANCTFYANRSGAGSMYLSPMSGGAIYAGHGATCAIANSLFWQNEGQACGTDNPHLEPVCDWAWNDLGAAPDTTDSWGDELEHQPGVIAQVANLFGVDPLFAAPVAADLHVLPGSPCVDAADGAFAPATDIMGSARWDDPSAADLDGCDADPAGCVEHADVGAFERAP